MGVGSDGRSTAAIIGDVPQNGCGPRQARGIWPSAHRRRGGRHLRLRFASPEKLATSAVGEAEVRPHPGPERGDAASHLARTRATCARTLRPAPSGQAACQGQPADSYNVACTPVQGGPDGWSYEAENHVIFFAGEAVPGLAARIEVQYYEEGKP